MEVKVFLYTLWGPPWPRIIDTTNTAVATPLLNIKIIHWPMEHLRTNKGTTFMIRMIPGTHSRPALSTVFIKI